MNWQLLPAFLLLHGCTLVSSATAPRTIALDPSGRMSLTWHTNSTTAHFRIDSAVDFHWIGMGLSPNGGMGNSDFVIIQRRPNTAILHDAHRPTSGNGRPSVDSSQDWHLHASSFTSGHYWVSFSRALDTCDSRQDRRITADTIRLLWAISPRGRGEPLDSHPPAQFVPYHMHMHAQKADRGARSVLLLQPDEEPEKPIQPPEPTKELELKVENVRLPRDSDTLYWCQVFRLPKWSKHHLIKTAPIFTPASNKRYVHHLTLYHCTDDLSAYVGHPAPCFDENGESGPMRACSTRIVAGWGVGGAPVTVLPNRFGYPFFEEGSSPFLVLEMHYDNSDGDHDVVDSSGIRLTLTPQLRESELGSFVLTLGVSPKDILVPPQSSDFVHSAFCDSYCMDAIPPEGIELISVNPHGHLAATSLRLRHYRGGRELPPILVDDAYDFNYQQNRLIQPPRRILKGDVLVGECRYQAGASPVFGGWKTSEEMCVFYMSYAPRVPGLSLMCMSAPWLGQTGFRNLLGVGDASTDEQIRAAAEKADWTGPVRGFPSRREAFQALLRDGSHYKACGRLAPVPGGQSERLHWDAENDIHPLPKPTRPWRPPQTCS